MLQHPTSCKVFELLHMDLMGPTQIKILGGKMYVFVVIDDFSRYTWTNFLKEKLDNFEVFKDLCQSIQEDKKSVIVKIRSEHDKKFENEKFSKLCAFEGISYEFSISS